MTLPSATTSLSRRTFLGGGIGVGSAALASLLARDAKAAPDSDSTYRGLPGVPHFAAKAKRVIILCMAGGPSHLETFDYKPKLAEMDGQPMPASYTEGQPIAQLQGKALKCQGPLTKFNRYGESGQLISDFLPWHAKMADDICVIRSMVTEQINHDPAHTFMNTGTAISGRPSMGAWVNYGLGSESEDLPGFVVMTSVGGRNPQPIASRQWDSGFLPSRFQGVEFNSSGDPVYYVRNPQGVDRSQQQRVVDSIGALNRSARQRLGDPEIDTRIAAYEMAYRMQMSVPELTDLSDEPDSTFDLYGPEAREPGTHAANCLMARRLAERDVRFIQLYHRGWDHHSKIPVHHPELCRQVDRGSAALVMDLKQRGLLEDTLVIWGGEFGRTVYSQGKLAGNGYGRDHHPRCFSMWMAGGGIKPGISYGQTDDYCYNIVDKQRYGVHVHDLNATILNQLGINHEKFTFRFQGLDYKLTGVEAGVHPVHDILA